jgi:uncharacterized protein involved in outer membrane biogenesis
MFHFSHRSAGAGEQTPLSRKRFLRLPWLGLLLSGAAILGAEFSPQLANWAVGRIVAGVEAQTGLAWRIGNAKLRWMPRPAILLERITIDGPASRNVAAKLTDATISGNLAGLLGGRGEWRVDLSGVSVRIPTRNREDSGQKAPSRALGAKISEMRATATGAEVNFDADHNVDFSASEMTLFFNVAPAERQRIDLDLIGKTYELKFGFVTDARVALSTGAPATFSIGPSGAKESLATGSGTFFASPTHLSFQSFEGVVGGVPFTGSAAIDLSHEPQARLDLHMRRLFLDVASAARDKQKGTIGLVLQELDPGTFVGFPLTANFEIDEMAFGKLRGGGVKARLTGDGRGLDIVLDARYFYNGVARAHYAAATSDKRQHELSLSINAGNVLPLVATITGTGALEGQGSVRLDVQAEGVGLDEIVSSARGTADFLLSDGKISSPVISELAEMPLISGIFANDRGLLTSFRRFSGSFVIAHGKAASTDLRFEAPLIIAAGRGSANLSTAKINFHFEPTLHAAGRPGGRLKIPVRVFGSWNNPEVIADFDMLLDNPLAAAQSLEDFGAALFGDDGPDAARQKPTKEGELGRKRHND